MAGNSNVLYVGDSKMAAISTRGQIARDGDYYLTISPQTGETAQQMESLVSAAVSGEIQTETIRKEDGETIGCGYEFERQRTVKLTEGMDEKQEFTFTERVQVIRSDAQQTQQSKTLEERIEKAHGLLIALTPEPGRGKRQHATEDSLKEAISQVLTAQRVEGLLRVEHQVEEKREVRLIGRGRNGANRPTREIITTRYVVRGVERDEAAIRDRKERLGWCVQLTNAPRSISLESCVFHYRANWRGERNYHRLKSEPLGIGPIFVRKDDQIIGKTNLLTLAARVESILELQVARGLKAEDKMMMGLHTGLPKQQTATPTAPTLLAAIVRSGITLTMWRVHNETTMHLTRLPSLLTDVLRYLHLPDTLYHDLRSISTFEVSNLGK
jgi:transposase